MLALCHRRNATQLGFRGKSYLNYNTITYESLVGKGNKNITLNQLPIEQVKDYACEDADITLQLFHILEKQLIEVEGYSLFKEVEMPLIPVLASMEQKGVRINIDFLKSYSEELQFKSQEIESQIIAYAGEDFNISSPKQLGIILFEKLKIIENAKLTKTKQYQTEKMFYELKTNILLSL